VTTIRLFAMPVIGQLIEKQSARSNSLARKDALGMDNGTFGRFGGRQHRALGSAATAVRQKPLAERDSAETAILPIAVINEKRNLPLAVRLHSISTIISTSTALLEGSPAIPTAERACLPLASPNTSTIKSEKPFTTRG
jgi:hypothetical protein